MLEMHLGLNINVTWPSQLVRELAVFASVVRIHRFWLETYSRYKCSCGAYKKMKIDCLTSFTILVVISAAVICLDCILS